MLADTARRVTDRVPALPAAMASTAMGLLLVAPRASPGCLALIVAAVVLSTARLPTASELRGRLASIPLPLILVLAFAVWGLISVAWAADRSEAINKSCLLAACTLVAGAGIMIAPDTTRDRLTAVAAVAVTVFGVGLAYLLIEEATGHAIKRTLFATLPFLQPSAKHVAAIDPSIPNDYISNRNMGAMVLVLWPVMLAALQTSSGSFRKLAPALVFAAALVTVGLSVHESSIIAAAASVVAFGFALTWRRAALGLAAVAWIFATLAVVPVASFAFGTAQLHKASWLPNSARHRIVIWGYTVEQVYKRPLLGIGMASTKLLDQQRGTEVERVPGTRYQWRTQPHTHNVYLQAWYELGAIGAVLFCAFGLSMLAAIARLPAAMMPYALAAFVSAALIGSFTWGLWQAWFLASFAVGAVMFAIARRATIEAQPERTPVPAPGSTAPERIALRSSGGSPGA